MKQKYRQVQYSYWYGKARQHATPWYLTRNEARRAWNGFIHASSTEHIFHYVENQNGARQYFRSPNTNWSWQPWPKDDNWGAVVVLDTHHCLAGVSEHTLTGYLQDHLDFYRNGQVYDTSRLAVAMTEEFFLFTLRDGEWKIPGRVYRLVEQLAAGQVRKDYRHAA